MSEDYDVKDADETFTLTVNRAKQWYIINPAIKITIDKGTEYKIANGQTLDIPITAGTHNIVFSSGLRKKAVDVQVSRNLSLNIGWNRLSGALEVK